MRVVKIVKRARVALIGTLVCALCASVAFAGARTKKNTHCGNSLKYVFYFIGDGMASVQIHATEVYLAQQVEDDAVAGSEKAQLLAMSQFPVQGMQTTFANNRMITGSAAAGTALACGMKTNINVISMDPGTTMNYNSLAEKAKEKGMKVGIVTSVTINHATPAVFYSHTATRKNYSDIASQLANSNFDYFGGGYWNNSGEDGAGMAEETATGNGFVITHNLADLQAQANGARVIAFDSSQDAGGHTGALWYDLDRGMGQMSLADFTAEGIRLLNNDNGFFMMVEGGKIDWACHANDAKAAIMDTIAFDNAIQEAIAFMADHPDETLIVVTGDHECGGMTIGYTSTGYDTHYEIIANQTMSFEKFNADVLAAYKTTHDPAPADIDADMWNIILTNFGLDGSGLTTGTSDDLNAYERKQLETAFDATMTSSGNSTEEDWALYDYYEPLTITLTSVLNERAGLSWTSCYHTGVPVPVLATGKYSELFAGFYDNTDIAKKIAQAMGVNLGN